MSSTHLTIERTEHGSVLTFDDPENENRLTDGMVDEIHAALDAADPNGMLVFRGNGDGFSAGRPHSSGGHPDGPAAAKRALSELVRLNVRIATWVAPTIGSVHGYANGAALGLLAHMDIVVADAGARFSFPEITYNLPPSLVASYLGRKIDDKAVRLLLMTGEDVGAERAREMGLISAVAPAGGLAAETQRLAAHLGARLEAEIEMKKTIAEFSGYVAGIEDDMQRGLAAVIRWTNRAKA